MTKQGEKIQAWADRAGITPRDYTGTFHAAADAMGIPPGPTDARMVTYLQRLTGSDETNLMNLEALAAKQRGADHWGALGLEVGDTWFYEFDGSTMYATIPDWTPNGLPFEVSVEAIPLTVDGTVQRLYGTTGIGPYAELQASTNVPRPVFRNTSGSGRAVTGAPAAVVGQNITMNTVLNGASAPTQWLATINNFVNGLTDTAAVGAAQVLNLIGASPAASSHFHGPIWNLRLADNSPLQNRYVCYGNGSRYVQLENPIVLEGDFEIEFDWIRQDGTGTASAAVLGSTIDDTYLDIWDSGSAAPGRLRIRIGGGNGLIENAYANVAIGQHCRSKLVRTGTSNELFIDGVSVGSATRAGTARIDLIGSIVAGGGRQIPTNSTLQNVIIRDLGRSLTWEFKLDEGAGTDALNTGNTAGGATSYDGAWVPDTDWQFIEDNSRFYPMGDNDATLKCYDGTGQRKPSADGTIVNHNPANWS